MNEQDAQRQIRSQAPRAAGYPESVTRLIDELARLPGIGRRSAERLAFHLLKSPADQALALSRAIEDVKRRIRHCRICYNLADTAAAPSMCSICASAGEAGEGTVRGGAANMAGRRETDRELKGSVRDGSIVMVVEQPKDLIALEQTGVYHGVYHVLMGRLSPMDSIGPGDLTISDLLGRLDEPSRNAGGVRVGEVVLALNPTLEGDGTALYLQEQIARRKLKLTRLARGLPSGRELEFANKAVLMDAIEGRRSM